MTTAVQPRRSALRRTGAVALVVVVLLLCYLGTVGVLRSRTLTLPVPSGPWPVGRAIVTVPAGQSPTGSTGESAGDGSRRAAWIWYPAGPGSAGTAPRAEYVPAGWSGPGTLPPTVGAGWLLQDVGAVVPSARSDAAPAARSEPVVVLAPGFETAPWMYTTLGEDLASRGHVVALLVPPTTPARVVDGRPRVSAPAASPPGGAQIDLLIEEQAADMQALFRSFASPETPIRAPVDTRAAVFAGHSLGGGAAVRGCEREPACVGSINMDGPQPALRPTRPELLLGSDHSCAAVRPCAGDGSAEYTDWLTRRREASPPTVTATVAGAGHNAFGDPVHYFVAPPARAASGVGTIPARRMHTVLTGTLAGTVEELLGTGRLGSVATGAGHAPELRAG